MEYRLNFAETPLSDGRGAVAELIRFGPFTLDPAAEELRRDGAVVPLQPQPTKVLLLLATRAGELVRREELRDAVWGPDHHVDVDQGLNWCIRRIREVLDDDAQAPRFVETLPRRGYRFRADAIAAPPLANAAPRRFGGVAATAFLLLALGTLLLHGRVGARDDVRILILPFENLSADPRRDLEAQRVTAELTGLAGALDPRRVHVIDRLTAAKLRRRHECIRELGRALDADFVLDGVLGPRRATAALYRVSDNTQVWSTTIAQGDTASLLAQRLASTFLRGS